MTIKKLIPDKGDFISVTFDPQSGHEQMGRRPALVISSHLFNEKTGLALVCPITSTNRNWPLHVRLPDTCAINGVVIVEQVKSIDFISRHAKLIEKAPQEVLNEVLAILDACIFDEGN